MKPIMSWEEFNSKRNIAYKLYKQTGDVNTCDLYEILGLNTDAILTSRGYLSWAEVDAALRAYADAHYTIVGAPEVKQSPHNSVHDICNSVVTSNNLAWDGNLGCFRRDEKQTPPIPVNMWITPNGYTTVQWEDGTKTTVKAEGENATEYGGFCACVVKKLYGSTTCGLKQMQKAIDGANWPKRKKEIEREKQKAYKREMAERRKHRLEEKIKFEIEQMKVKREAERRLNESEEKMMYE